MIFSLDLRPALKGDCFLLHFGTAKKPGLVIVDGGPKTVYAKYLKPRIKQIRDARKLSGMNSLPVDLLMVSHVDDDHIQGILDLTEEEIRSVDAHRPRMIDVMSFWHNSFDAILDRNTKDIDNSIRKNFQSAMKGGQLTDVDKERLQSCFIAAHPEDDDGSNLENVSSALMVLASIAQGYRLRKDAERLKYPSNPEFNGKLVLAKAKPKPISFGNGLKLTVVGPMEPEILALRKMHQEWLDKLAKQGLSADEALATYVDKSIPNLSSIVVMAEANGKRMLLTGDARGDKVIEGLQFAGLLAAGDSSKIEVDLLKAPHHGSARNLDHDFFERIIAQHYVFSGNGQHGNPERESFEMLIAARGDDAYQVHLTYPVEIIDQFRKEDWEKERNKEVNRKAKKIRPAWSAKKHSLAALLKDNPEFAGKIRVVEEGASHVIDLDDKLGDAWPKLA